MLIPEKVVLGVYYYSTHQQRVIIAIIANHMNLDQAFAITFVTHSEQFWFKKVKLECFPPGVPRSHLTYV